MKDTYNREDKVFFDAYGNVIVEGAEHQNVEQEPSIVEYKKQQKAKPNPEAIQEAESEPNTRTSEEETRRPKREITKPQYLKDFVEK